MRLDLRTIARWVSAAVLAAACAPTHSRAEPALDRVLSRVQVANQKSCTALNIGFNLRVRYMSHFPIEAGQELRIMLTPIDGARAAAEILSRRESLRAPETRFAKIRAIDFEAGGSAGPVLVIQFDQPARFQVSQGADFQSIVVKLFGDRVSSTCVAQFSSESGVTAWETSVVPEAGLVPEGPGARAAAHGKGTASAEQARSAAAMLDEGRARLRKSDFEGAIAKFRSVLLLPQSPSSAEAQELMALAYQKSKRNDAALAEYRDYLARYPSGEGADRVRQRLAGIETALSKDASPLKAAKSGAVRDDGTQTWTVSGSVSQFYIRDDSFRTVRDPSLPQTPNAELDAHDVHRNQILSSLDTVATWSGYGVKSKLRFSGTEEHDISGERPEIVGVAALYLDTAVRDWGFESRIGRQTRNSGGVIGRFDGAAFSFAAAQPFRINAVVGSPVLRRRDEPYVDEKLFYGASVDFGPYYGFDMSVFAIEQRARDVLDRQAVGGELRYADGVTSAFAMVDYDIHYQELNAAVLTGNWTFADRSNLHAGIDYRKSPYLSTWNALQGQAYPTLYEMLRVNTLAQVEEFAVDRTATFTSASAGFSQPLNDRFQLSGDLTVTNYSGTPGSGGVPETIGTGNEYFYSAQVIGNGVFAADDMMIAGFRFADLDTSNYYVADFSMRYPLMDQLKINPRLMLGYRTGDDTDLEQFTVLPSVLFNYYVTRDWSLELETGVQWTWQKENGVEEKTTDLFFTVGYRYDFYADGTVLSNARAAPYGLGVR